MKRQWKQHEKDELINQKVKVNVRGITAWGYISGRKLDFPIVFCREFKVSCETSWDLAYRAVHEGVTIQT